MKQRYLIPVLCAVIMAFAGKAQTPVAVTKNLQLAGKNKAQLQRAISYFSKQGDKQKLQALYFLIANMDAHLSANYYWTNAKGKKIEFDELKFKDYAAAQAALAKLKATNRGMHAIPYIAKDLETIKAADLIENVDQAFAQWRAGAYKKISFDAFCQYVLPYRVSVEPYQRWRSVYGKSGQWLGNLIKQKGIQTALVVLKADQRSFFASTWGLETRKEPLPRLGAQQLIQRRKGMCEDGVAFTLFNLRSQGVPCVQNMVPFWGTSTGGHFFSTIYDTKMMSITYDQFGGQPINRQLGREPGKVIRITYAKQSITLASQVKAPLIPDGFLRTKNYVDVTEKYWPVSNANGAISHRSQSSVVYACVFNGLRWRPIWWAKPSGSQFTFHNMAKGCVYLPAWYQNKKLVQAGYPLALGYNNQIQLVPNKIQLSPLVLQEQEGYLKFKPNTGYRLYYWDQKWVLAGKQRAGFGSTQLVFDKVPSNALYLLLGDKPIGKERPFIITPQGERVWF